MGADDEGGEPKLTVRAPARAVRVSVHLARQEPVGVLARKVVPRLIGRHAPRHGRGRVNDVKDSFVTLLFYFTTYVCRSGIRVMNAHPRHERSSAS